MTIVWSDLDAANGFLSNVLFVRDRSCQYFLFPYKVVLRDSNIHFK